MAPKSKPPPNYPDMSTATPVLPVTADPTLVPQHTTFQSADPILRESLTRIDRIATAAQNSYDVHSEKNPDAAAKFMFHQLRAEKLRLEVIKTYSELALEARKVVSTDVPVAKDGAQQNEGFAIKNLPQALEQAVVDILARRTVVLDVNDGTGMGV